jgi:hypothetical protein
VLKWVMDQCGGEFALSSQFRRARRRRRLGRPDVDFFEDPDGKIKLCFVDEDEMYRRPAVGRPDRRRCARTCSALR